MRLRSTSSGRNWKVWPRPLRLAESHERRRAAPKALGSPLGGRRAAPRGRHETPCVNPLLFDAAFERRPPAAVDNPAPCHANVLEQPEGSPVSAAHPTSARGQWRSAGTDSGHGRSQSGLGSRRRSRQPRDAAGLRAGQIRAGGLGAAALDPLGGRARTKSRAADCLRVARGRNSGPKRPAMTARFARAPE